MTFVVLIVCPIESSERAKKLLSMLSISTRDIRSSDCVMTPPILITLVV